MFLYKRKYQRAINEGCAHKVAFSFASRVNDDRWWADIKNANVVLPIRRRGYVTSATIVWNADLPYAAVAIIDARPPIWLVSVNIQPSVFASEITYIGCGTMDDSERQESSPPLDDWPVYISHLLQSGHVSDALIVRADGRTLARSRLDFCLSDDELAAIRTAFEVSSRGRTRAAISVNGHRYRIHLTDGGFGIMAKEGLPARGCSVCKTNRLLVVGVHSERMLPDVCNEVVMTLGDYFISKDMWIATSETMLSKCHTL